MRQAQFNDYLAGLDEAAGPGPGRCSRLCNAAVRAEQQLGFNLDNADLSEQGVGELVAALPSECAAEFRAALRAYGRFMAYYRARA